MHPSEIENVLRYIKANKAHMREGGYSQFPGKPLVKKHFFMG